MTDNSIANCVYFWDSNLVHDLYIKSPKAIIFLNDAAIEQFYYCIRHSNMVDLLVGVDPPTMQDKDLARLLIKHLHHVSDIGIAWIDTALTADEIKDSIRENLAIFRENTDGSLHFVVNGKRICIKNGIKLNG